MKTLIRRGVAGALLLAAALILALLQSPAQESANKRRLLDHTAPPYPTLARNMGLEGVVKIDVLVAPDGSAKSLNVQGGHPVLAQAATNAVRHWRWEAASHESHELVQVKFSPAE